MLFATDNENNINIRKDQQTICSTAMHTNSSNAFQSKHPTRINAKTNLENCWSKTVKRTFADRRAAATGQPEPEKLSWASPFEVKFSIAKHRALPTQIEPQ